MQRTKMALAVILIAASTAIGGYYVRPMLNTQPTAADVLKLDDQTATIRAVQQAMPAVVSIGIYEPNDSITIDLSTGQQSQQSGKVLKGSGSGFLISADGYILTNKHVVDAGSTQADYRVTLTNKKTYYAQVIGRDPLNDLAVLKIYDKNLPYLQLGDSKSLPIGTTVLAIGNALGEYPNSVTKGIISGVGRSITAGDLSGSTESLDNILQTDAEINPGNSGGPLINLSGQVIGINVAIDKAGSSIGFAIPVNDAKPVINSIKTANRIIRPRLGLRYAMIEPDMATSLKLTRDSGALVSKGDNGEPATMAGGPAEKAGIQDGDIIFEVGGQAINDDNPLLQTIQNYKPGDKIKMKIQRGKQVIEKTVVLDEFK